MQDLMLCVSKMNNFDNIGWPLNYSLSWDKKNVSCGTGYIIYFEKRVFQNAKYFRIDPNIIFIM